MAVFQDASAVVVEEVAARDTSADRTKIAVWVDTESNGCNTASAACIQKLAREAELEVETVCSADIASGKLVDGRFAALAIGGGELAAVRALGPEGFKAIQGFCHGGGGYTGFCLGAYLAGTDYLHLCETKFVHDPVLSGCFDGPFCEHHDFGNPADRTWMICGQADMQWIDDVELPRPVDMMVSHPPAMELTGDSDAVCVLARFGKCDDVEWYPHGPKCPMTASLFHAAVKNSLSGKVAVASTRSNIIITAAHPEMSNGTENEELTKVMLRRAAGLHR
mmetsp:Transcript_34336/g.69390  ORF Transcript_34336/g.69390 Transcript_34336/m.69390 type:complete len:279 (-) Transcript_34336:132-968(-)